ncbi:thioredoxin-disulfide reductase [Candidatus Dependentiae bacterium]|nr:thioredoxin-disulfide reductase [Candidatus Dependentiae bacterium]
MSLHTTHKLLIIGSGPAGLTAAIYAGRAGLQPIVLEGDSPGGQLMGTTYIENWPGEKSILGPDLMIKMRDQAKHFGAQLISQDVLDVDFNHRPFTVISNKQTYTAHSVIIATGATPKRLKCPGEDTYWGKGVTSCAVCDGAFYKDRKVVIVGGGDTAMENASFMTNFTNDITLVHILPHLTASWPMQERVIKDPRIKIVYQSTVTAINGDGKNVQSVDITNQQTGEKSILSTDGVFIAIGLSPNTHLFKGQISLNDYGYILLDDHTRTSVPGVFAAGDVADARYRQAITSAGSGCAAALDAERYLKELSL